MLSVAKKMNLPFYEVPTGWKFFGNLMDHYEKLGNAGFICGEESFGTGSAHIREKDGIWAVLAWLSILSHANPDLSKPIVSVGDIVRDHWNTYGRDFYCRYDYEECDAVAGDKLMQHLRNSVAGWTGSTVQSSAGPLTIVQADDFEYKDPVDHSVSSKQGVRIKFEDGSRIVFRLSGTGSVGATVRVYIEKYDLNPAHHGQSTGAALEPLIKLALDLSKLKEFTGRETPTVIT
jgi:phosphoglucomutase